MSIPKIETIFQSGFFAGNINLNGETCAVIVAPKTEGEYLVSIKWNDTYNNVQGATSYFDGLSNTKLMAASGSKLAQWALDLRIGGKDDWHIPAQDVLEVLYRAFKPTTDKNSQWGRSGINLSSLPATYPYTLTLPAQVAIAAFQSGGDQAFASEYYWSSTQHAAASDYAWYQYFDYGYQDYSTKGFKLRARAVRVVKL